MRNGNRHGDIGSDGSTDQQRVDAAGYQGDVAQTVAINLALAISGIELMRQWHYNPAYKAIVVGCANSDVGVWSETSLDRTVVVVVGVDGQPERAADSGHAS